MFVAWMQLAALVAGACVAGDHFGSAQFGVMVFLLGYALMPIVKT
jgi:hypothetical protein